MKKQIFSKIYLKLGSIIILLFFQNVFSQEGNFIELKEFEISVENTSNGLNLKCLEGCAWKEITFSNKNYNPQGLNEYGMTTVEEDNDSPEHNLADFLFTIAKNEKGISLKGYKGTTWTNLSSSINLNETIHVNQKGLRKK